MALLSHILAAAFFKVNCLLALAFIRCYNSRMTKPLAQAIKIIRELPEDQQDTIVHQLMRLIELAQSTDTELASASGDGLS